MKQGGSRTIASGFTIVEVLIVLAVTGLLFISAVGLINGRQGKTEFQTAINDLQQQLQQTINQTGSGYYPNDGSFTCNGSTSPVTFQSGAASQGTNGGCIFLGNALQFGDDSSTSNLDVIPLVGNQYNVGTFDAVQTVQVAAPRAVYPVGTEPASLKSTITMDLMEYGLIVAAANPNCNPVSSGMCYMVSGTPHGTGIIAFVSGDSSGQIASSDGEGLQSGSEQLSLYGVASSSPNQSLSDATQQIGNVSGKTTGLVSASSASICIASSTSSQSGLLTIDNGLHVSLRVFGDTVC